LAQGAQGIVKFGMRPRKFNLKRKIEDPPSTEGQRRKLEDLASKATYTGNPVHKRSPGDYGLTPPASPRPGKTLCDGSGIFSRKVATEKLRLGIEKGLVSQGYGGNWPQNVWAVADNGVVLEAMLEDGKGRYHGYPLQSADPLVQEIKKRWSQP
jgi:hypothetical protein